MNLGRISVIATNVFREAVRDRILYIIGFYALILAAAMRLLPEFAATTEQKIFLDFGLAAMSAIGLIIAVFVGTGLVNKEIEKRTILVLIAKPVSRSEFIIGIYSGLLTVLAVLIAAMTVIYLVFLQLEKIAYPTQSILLAAIFLFLQLSLVTAVAITLGVFTSSLLATALTFGIYLMGNITQDLLQLGRLGSSPGIERLTQALYLILPDLSRLDLKNQAVYGLAALPETNALLTNAGYGLIYIVMLLAIAILIFSQRQF
ncbi:ABC transporter permease [Iningainema tapete]|uniref:ABC transporter permease subunit n=1 Tax=Iningainema tapete BLCC-T55 TaxID=2748662 RepID=A0A8J6XBT6_9CYAN|nr:ABC transporter permease subunit [Iningainema tapete]MBD2771924.1 ABC transporter permease subunit [Iningainema tapete BLCC-T55]